MTGYGQASTELGDARVTVELRSLNHRYADLRLRLPAELAGAEAEIRPAFHCRNFLRQTNPTIFQYRNSWCLCY